MILQNHSITFFCRASIDLHNLYSMFDRFDSRSVAAGGRRVEPGSSGSVFLGVSVVKVIVDGLKRYQMMFLVNWEPGKV